MTDVIAYSVDDAAAAVGFSARTIRRAIADGELLVHYRNGSPRILRTDLEAWVAAWPTERAAS